MGARAALFDTGPSGELWTGSRALVPWTPGRCPDCAGDELRQVTVAEPTLFRHGGYGATRATTVDVCGGCGYRRTVNVTELSPR
jgi:hypothetical protein